MLNENCQPRSENLTSTECGKSVLQNKTPVKFLLQGQPKIKEITQKQAWEDFLLECEEKTFLDSWNWGEFQKKKSASFLCKKFLQKKLTHFEIF